MNLGLYRKYGDYNKDGYFIEDLEKWHFYAQRPKTYRRKKMMAYCCIIIPIAGIIPLTLIFEEMGLSYF